MEKEVVNLIPIRIQIVHLETDFDKLEVTPTGPPPPAGSWVKSYDPEFFNGRGMVEWTENWREAKTFDTMIEAIDFYRQVSVVRPWRADGKPNRPLTSFTVTFTREVPNGYKD